MTSKPSRSEIENALAGRTSRSQAKPPKRPKNVDFEFEASPRRQQVIGGDLTGISKRKKGGLFGRYGDVSIANWIAAGIVLLIVAAFFWPQGDESVKEVAEQKAQQAQQSIYTESRIEEVEVPNTPEDQAFSRDDDLARADQFREADEQELTIRALLDTAERQFANGAYTQPSNGNAVVSYKEVLALNPNNVDAQQGLEKINHTLLDAGLAMLEKNRKTQAEKTLAKMALVSQESEQYQELNDAIAVWKVKREVGKLLAKASKAQRNEDLILPARKNALYYYRQVLEVDAENQKATDGIKQIADSYVDKTNTAILQGQYEAAAGYLATVSVIDAKHPSIDLMEALIAKAEPIAKTADTEPADAVATKQDENTQQEPTTAAETVDEAAGEQQDSKPEQTVASIATETPAVTPTRPTSISSNKTPRKEASEQAAFDRQYLRRGLEAYYKGDYDAAASLLQPLADKGVSRAQFRIGYMYYLGRGFKKNRQEADRIIRAALPAIQKFAAAGRTWAQSDLGSLYEDGLVLPRNYAEAVYWYRSAAEKGYPGAQTNLGIMYALGRGVTSSRRTAIEWFQRAAKQGDIVAKRNLEAMGI